MNEKNIYLSSLIDYTKSIDWTSNPHIIRSLTPSNLLIIADFQPETEEDNLSLNLLEQRSRESSIAKIMTERANSFIIDFDAHCRYYYDDSYQKGNLLGVENNIEDFAKFFACLLYVDKVHKFRNTIQISKEMLSKIEIPEHFKFSIFTDGRLN